MNMKFRTQMEMKRKYVAPKVSLYAIDTEDLLDKLTGSRHIYVDGSEEIPKDDGGDGGWNGDLEID